MKTSSYAAFLASFAFFSAPALPAQNLLSEDFESYTSGDILNATSVAPGSNTATAQNQIVSGAANTAGGGTGNGLRIYDNDPGGVGFEFNLVPDALSQVSTLHVSFDIAWNSDPGSGNESFVFTVGNYYADTGTTLRLNSNSRRMFGGVFRENGEYRWSGGGGNSGDQSMGGVGNALTFDIYVNDHETDSISFTDPTSTVVTLNPNSFSVYGPDSFFYTSGLDNLAGISASDAGIGRLGIYSGTGNAGPDFIIDNLSASVIPEPSFYAALGGLCALLFVLRRRVAR